MTATETTQRNLTFKEELGLAVLFSNVEKFKCLSTMPLFKKTLLTEPFRIGMKDKAPLLAILSCLKVLYVAPGHEKLQQRNDEIIAIVKERCRRKVTEKPDLDGCYPEHSDESVDSNYHAYVYAMVKWFRGKGYGPGKESWEGLVAQYDTVINNALRENNLKSLEKRLMDEEIEAGRKEADEPEPVSRYYTGRRLPEELKEFLDGIDQPGAVLAMFDEGKAFARVHFPEDPYLIHSDIIEYVLTSTKHITLRVGGYSYRVAQLVLNIADKLCTDPWRVECLSEMESHPENDRPDVTCTRIRMRDFEFESDDPFVKYAEEYDFKYFSMGSDSYPMVYYYVNKIDTGFYKEDGSFVPFYSNGRGLEALTDVAMVRGYKDIRPATAAIYTDSGRGRGDSIFFGPAYHMDKKKITRGSSQRKLFEDAEIKYFNLDDVKKKEE